MLHTHWTLVREFLRAEQASSLQLVSSLPTIDITLTDTLHVIHVTL
jgi:hypothetical protein